MDRNKYLQRLGLLLLAGVENRDDAQMILSWGKNLEYERDTIAKYPHCFERTIKELNELSLSDNMDYVDYGKRFTEINRKYKLLKDIRENPLKYCDAAHASS
ncbi:MAG: hypothetical protein WC781_04960 [Candidatus Pacearchaeota archaeon]|jgi:hypothetical protein